MPLVLIVDTNTTVPIIRINVTINDTISKGCSQTIPLSLLIIFSNIGMTRYEPIIPVINAIKLVNENSIIIALLIWLDVYPRALIAPIFTIFCSILLDILK